MNTLKYILVLSITTLLATVSIADGIPFTVEGGLIIVTASVDGEDGRFVFDTGSSDLLLNATTDTEGAAFETANGAVAAEEVQVSAVKLGAVTRPNVVGYEMNLAAVQSLVSGDLKGILGGALFSDHSVYIDFTLYEIQFFSESVDHSVFTHSLSFEVIDGVPMTTVLIGEVDRAFIIDSGATAHFVDRQVLEEIDGARKLAIGTDVVTAGSKQEQAYYIIPVVALGTASLKDTRVVSGSFAHLSQSRDVAGLLSLRALASQSMLLDNVQKKLYFN